MSNLRQKIISIILLITLSVNLLAQRDTTKDMTFDLGFTRDKNVNLWPLLKRTNTPNEKDLQLFFTLYRKHYDVSSHTKHSHLFPIFFNDSSANKRDFRLFSLYYPSLIRITKETKTETNSFKFLEISSFKFLEIAPKISLFEITRSPNGVFIDNNFLFLLWYKNNQIEKKSFLVFFPLYWNYKTPTYSTSTLFPLFSAGKYNNLQNKYLIATPLFWHFENADGYSNTFFPLYWNRKRGSGDDAAYTNVVFPLYWSYKSKASKTNILFPLLWNFKSPYFHSFTLVPLVSYGRSADSSSRYLTVTPLFWHYQNKYYRLNTLFPIYWNIKNTTNGTTKYKNIVFPIFWSFRDDFLKRNILFPIVWTYKTPLSHYYTLFPLFSVGSNADKTDKYLVVTPLFWHTKVNSNYSNILFPIYWNKKTGEGANAKYSNVVFPIFWSYSDSLTNRKFLFPLYYHKRTGFGENAIYKNVVFPIFYSHRDNFLKRNVLFPIVWTYKTPLSHYYTLFPLFSVGSNADKTDKYLVVTPLFWHTKVNNNYSNILFPIYWNKKTGEGANAKYSNVVFPIFWSYSDSLTNRKFLFPLYLHKRTGFGENAIYKNVVFPIFYSHRDNFLKRNVLFPIVWTYKTPLSHYYTLFPLFSVGSNADKTDQYLVVTPLFWHTKVNDNYSNILFPLVWNYKRGSGEYAKYRTVVFPIIWTYKDHNISNKVFFPIAFSFKNPYYRSLTLMPFFSVGEATDHSRKHLAITPLFWHLKEGANSHNVFFPLFWNSKKVYPVYIDSTKTTYDTIYKNVLFPVFWSYKDRRVNNKVLFPIAWSLKNPYYHSLTLMPIFSVGESTDKSRNHFALTPLFWHFKKYDNYSNTLFPIFWNSKKGTGEDARYRNVLFPIIWSYKDKYVNNKVFFPIAWSLKNPDYHSLTLMPFFSIGESTDKTRNYRAITPLFWHFKDHDNYSNTLFPIVWNSKTGSGEDARYQTNVLPLYWSFQDKYQKYKILFPVLWQFKTPTYRSLTLAPFFSVGQSTDSTIKHLVITPLLWKLKNKDYYSTILFPIFWDKKQGTGENLTHKTTVFPLYWAYEDKNRKNKVFFPFAWSFKNEHYRSLALIPLFSVGQSQDNTVNHLVITPFYWHFKDKNDYTNVLFPLFWDRKEGTGENQIRKTTLFPLFWAYQDKYKSHKVFFPFAWSFKNQYYRSLTLMPFFSVGKSSDSTRNHLAITPLFWHFENKNGYSNTVFPLYWNRKTGVGENAKYSNVLFPIYWSYRDKDRSHDVVFPLVWHYNNLNYRSFTFAPLVSYGRSKLDSSNHLVITPLFWHFRNRTSYSNLLLPIWWNSKTGSGEYEKYTAVLFPLYWSHTEKDKSYNVFFPLVWKFKNTVSQTFAILPFYSRTKANDGSFSYLMATPFFWQSKTKEGTTNVLFPFWWNKRTGSGENAEYKNIVFPLYYSVRDKNRSNKMLFPIMFSFKNQYYKSFTLFPLISAGSSANDSIKHLVITPLFWDTKNNGRHNVNLVPLFSYSSKSGGDSKFSILYFLLRYKHKDQSSKLSFIWPLCEYQSDVNYRYFRFAPLVWHEKTADSQYTSVLPFFYKSSNKEMSSFYFLLGLYSHRNYFNVKTSNNVLWKTLYWDKYANGDHEFRFFYLFIASMKKDGVIEKSFFPFYYYWEQPNGDMSKSVLLYFFNSFKRQIPDSKEFYQEKRIFWFVRIQSNYKRLKERGLIK